MALMRLIPNIKINAPLVMNLLYDRLCVRAVGMKGTTILRYPKGSLTADFDVVDTYKDLDILYSNCPRIFKFYRFRRRF